RRRIRPGPGAHPGAGEELDRRPEVRPANRGEPAHAEPGPGVRRGVPRPPREVVSAAPPGPLAQDRRLGRDGGTVRLRPDIRPEATRLDLVQPAGLALDPPTSTAVLPVHPPLQGVAAGRGRPPQAA